jgi:hypothetical protein
MTARVTAVPIPIVFNDGSTYQFSPLTDKDLDELDEWMQSRLIEAARRSLSKSASQEERDETLRVAMREATKLTFLSPDGARMIATLPGMTHLCYLSLRKCHPDVDEPSLHKLLSDPENLSILNEKFDRANHVSNGKIKRKNRPRAKK